MLFSKASDKLPLHKHYDHKIELLKNEVPPIEPLRQQTSEQLIETKRYIMQILHKGFIEPLTASCSAAPILFVKKPNGKLRFCVDYWKLNALTKKDQYSLPLISEIMNRIGEAKVFIKLDIRQAFHRIKMSKEAEDLTTF